MTDDTPTITAGCLCEAVRYELDGPLRPVVACHCGQCRKTSGHFVAATVVARDALVLRDRNGLAWYRSSPRARRGFCALCGSSLSWDADGSGTIAVMAGTIDGPTSLHTEAHIHCADRGDYYDSAGGLPRHPASWQPAGGS